MAKYHFHLTHSEECRDESCVDLETLQAAKCHAVKMISDDLCDAPQKFWDSNVYRVLTTNEEGLHLFSVEMFATLAPVLRPLDAG